MAVTPHAVGETDFYVRQCDKLGLDEPIRQAIVSQVSRAPSAGAIVQGSGGLRKVRFEGSGGYRLLVAYLGTNAPAYLMAILSKGQQANFSPAQIAALHGKIKVIKQKLKASS